MSYDRVHFLFLMEDNALSIYRVFRAVYSICLIAYGLAEM